MCICIFLQDCVGWEEEGEEAEEGWEEAEEEAEEGWEEEGVEVP